VAVYLVRRFLFAASLVVAVSFAAFAIFGISFDPGYPFMASPAHIDHVKHAFLVEHYHLHDDIVSRYWRWLGGVFRHGFGNTVSLDIGEAPIRFLSDGEPITPVVLRAFEVTAAMVGFALLLVTVLSSFIGTFAAQRRRFRGDLWARGLAYVGACLPTFLVADLVRRWLLPHSSVVSRGGSFQVVSEHTWLQPGPPGHGIESWAQHLLLPAVALALALAGIYARYIRSSMLVALGQQYVTVARAKGVREWRVAVRHALRNSLIPFTALLSLEMGGVIGASLAADGVFGTGGLASAFLQAVGRSDPFLLTAIFTITAVLVAGFAFLSDFAMGLLDPRR
jgi:peptide/nickel transport system permease protein